MLAITKPYIFESMKAIVSTRVGASMFLKNFLSPICQYQSNVIHKKPTLQSCLSHFSKQLNRHIRTNRLWCPNPNFQNVQMTLESLIEQVNTWEEKEMAETLCKTLQSPCQSLNRITLDV